MPSTKHIFTQADIAAMRKAVEKEYASESALARAAKIGQASSINQYCNGKTPTCTQAVWDRLYPLIAPYYENVPPSTIDNVTKLKAPATVKDITEVLEQFAPGRQIITGVINVYGVPIEKINTAINDSSLSAEQKRELKEKIFLES